MILVVWRWIKLIIGLFVGLIGCFGVLALLWNIINAVITGQPIFPEGQSVGGPVGDMITAAAVLILGALGAVLIRDNWRPWKQRP